MVFGVSAAVVLLLFVVVPTAVGLALTQAVGRFVKKRGESPFRVRTTRILITAIWVSIDVYGLTAVFGPPSFLSTLTVSAIAGIAVSLALQTTLQNIVAGFLVLRQGMLRYGDTIQSGGVRGRVVSIGLVTTIIRMEDGTLAMLSNSTILNGPTLNATATTRLAGEY